MSKEIEDKIETRLRDCLDKTEGTFRDFGFSRFITAEIPDCAAQYGLYNLRKSPCANIVRWVGDFFLFVEEMLSKFQVQIW
jgi:hypothetical protein